MTFSELLQQVMKTEELKERVFSIKHPNKEGWMEYGGFFLYCTEAYFKIFILYIYYY